MGLAFFRFHERLAPLQFENGSQTLINGVLKARWQRAGVFRQKAAIEG